MKITRNTIRYLVIALFGALGIAAVVPMARPYPQYQVKAKQLGYPAQNCAYCHAAARGGQGWNERGRWLVEQKGKRKATQVDVAWLKDYRADAKSSGAPTRKPMPRRKGKQ